MFACLLEGNGRVAHIRQVDETRFVVDITIGNDEDTRLRSHTEKYRHMAFAVALMWIDKGK